MDKREISQRTDDSRRTLQCNNRDSKFDVLRRSIEKINRDISSTRGCYEYVMSEIKSENDNINRLLLWNQKRIVVLCDLQNKIEKLINEQQLLYNEMFDIIKCNFDENVLNDFKTQNLN